LYSFRTSVTSQLPFTRCSMRHVTASQSCCHGLCVRLSVVIGPPVTMSDRRRRRASRAGMYSLGDLPHLRCLSLEGSERLRDIHLRVLAVRRVTMPPEPHPTVARSVGFLSGAQPHRVCNHGHPCTPLSAAYQCHLRCRLPPRAKCAALSMASC